MGQKQDQIQTKPYIQMMRTVKLKTLRIIEVKLYSTEYRTKTSHNNVKYMTQDAGETKILEQTYKNNERQQTR